MRCKLHPPKHARHIVHNLGVFTIALSKKVVFLQRLFLIGYENKYMSGKNALFMPHSLLKSVVNWSVSYSECAAVTLSCVPIQVQVIVSSVSIINAYLTDFRQEILSPCIIGECMRIMHPTAIGAISCGREERRGMDISPFRFVHDPGECLSFQSRFEIDVERGYADRCVLLDFESMLEGVEFVIVISDDIVFLEACNDDAGIPVYRGCESINAFLVVTAQCKELSICARRYQQVFGVPGLFAICSGESNQWLRIGV